jgi:predicted nuclease with TOPRIM domain
MGSLLIGVFSMIDQYSLGSENKHVENVLKTLATLEGDVEVLIDTLNKKMELYDQANRLDELAKSFCVSAQYDIFDIKKRFLEVSETIVKSTNLVQNTQIDSKLE